MKETFGQKTRRSHKRNQRVVMFWCAFVFAFVIAGVWLFRGTLFQNDSGASSSGTNQSRHDACGTADSRQKSTDVTQAPMDHEVWQKLQDLVSQDQRVQQVIDNCEIYPEDILKMLSRNLDMLNFVLEYPEKVGQVFAETVGEVEVGEVPLLLQYDQRWGYGDYGNSSVAVSGCGPACLYGEQRCDYIMVSGGEVSGALLGDLLTNFEFEPSWTLDTWFLAIFNGTGINGGNITPSGDSITGAAVYRLKKGDRRLQLVANVGIGSSTLVDEGFRNQSTYTYYVFVLGTNTYVSAPLISNPVTPMFWNWTVLDCSVDSNGTYHLEEAHLFRNSVSTDSISNNNAPSMLQNFTPYPLRQPSSYNFKSSTLTGYIGRLDMKLNQYIDTVDMAEALYNLSVSNNPKFLRDRKGNLWRIQTNAAVSMQTGDTMVPQPYFGSFPWAEVGAADGISIICQPGDGAWDSTTGQEPDSGETVTKIVVTAPFGSTVTLTNGQESYTEVCYGYITYQPATPGDWTVTAMRDGSSASETITMAEGVTYYVGLVITEVYATLIIAAPSGTVITVSQGSEFEETKVVP